MKYTILILNTNASNCTFTLDVDLRYTSKAFPALSRIQRALDKFLTNNTHWLAEDEPQIVAVLQSDSPIRIKYTSGTSLKKIEPLIA
jgi:hypothetical protein